MIHADQNAEVQFMLRTGASVPHCINALQQPAITVHDAVELVHRSNCIMMTVTDGIKAILSLSVASYLFISRLPLWTQWRNSEPSTNIWRGVTRFDAISLSGVLRRVASANKRWTRFWMKSWNDSIAVQRLLCVTSVTTNFIIQTDDVNRFHF